MSSVTDSAQFFPKQGTFQFLQDAYTEAINNIIIGLIGTSVYDSTKVYILNGISVSSFGSNRVFSGGAVFYNGELYTVDSGAVVARTSDPLFITAQTQYTTNADPVTFSDSTVHNIHNIRKMQIVSGVSGGSGTTNYVDDWANAITLNFVVPPIVNLSGSAVVGSYPNFTINIPGNSLLTSGNCPIGDVAASSGTTITVTFGNIGTSDYVVTGSIVSLGSNPTLDSSVSWSVIESSKTDSQFQIHLQESGGSQTQNISFDYAIFRK